MHPAPNLSPSLTRLRSRQAGTELTLWHLTLLAVNPGFITDKLQFPHLFNASRCLVLNRQFINPSSSCLVLILLAKWGWWGTGLATWSLNSLTVSTLHLLLCHIQRRITKKK